MTNNPEFGKKALEFLFLLMSSSLLAAGNFTPYFQRIGSEQGLSRSTVFSIVQDTS